MTRLRTLFVIVFLAAYTLVAFADKEWDGKIPALNWNGNIPAPNSVSGLSYWIWADGVLVIDSQSKVAQVGKNNKVTIKGRIEKGAVFHTLFLKIAKDGKIFRSIEEYREYLINDDKEYSHWKNIGYCTTPYDIYIDNKIEPHPYNSKNSGAFGEKLKIKDTYSQIKIVAFGYYCGKDCPGYKANVEDPENHPCGELVIELDVVDNLEASSPADAEYVGPAEEAGKDDSESTGGIGGWLKRNWGWVAGLGGAAGAGGAIAMATSGGGASKEPESETLPPPPPPAAAPPIPQPGFPPPPAPQPVAPPPVAPQPVTPPPPAVAPPAPQPVAPPPPPQPAPQPKPEPTPEPQPEPIKPGLTPAQQKYIEGLQDKYGIPRGTSFEDTKEEIRWRQKMNEYEGESAMKEAELNDAIYTGLKLVQTMADTGVDVIATTVPGAGKGIQAVYIVAKNAAGETSSAIVNGTSIADGLVKAGFNSAVEITQASMDKFGAKYAANIIGDAAKATFSGVMDGKSAEEIAADAGKAALVGGFRTAIDQAGSKIIDGISKKIKDAPGTLLESTAKYNKWVANKDISERAGKQLREDAIERFLNQTGNTGNKTVEKSAREFLASMEKYKGWLENKNLRGDMHKESIDALKEMATTKLNALTQGASATYSSAVIGNAAAQNTFNAVTGD